MTRKIHCDRRLLVVLLLLCVMVAAQSSTLAAQSIEHHATEHCCLLCHVGVLPFLQTSVSAVIAPLFHVVWLAPPANFDAPSDVRVIPSSSRAPPAL
jgi:hypothetical protein